WRCAGDWRGWPMREPLPMTPRSPPGLQRSERRHFRSASSSVARCGKRCAMARRPGVATVRQIQGKELSYNNLADTDAAFECVAEFDDPAVVIVKHANPCGVATAASLAEAWDGALRCDPVSAYGGIIAVNRTLDGAAAEKIAAIFTEVIVAPDADAAAIAALA